MSDQFEPNYDLLHADLERYVKRLQIFNKVGRELSAAVDTEHIYEIVVKAIAEALNCTHCTFFALEDDRLVPRKWYSTRVTRCFALGEGLVGRAAESAEPILASDAKKHTWFSEGQTRPEVDRSIIVVPVEVDGEVVGVLSADQDRVNAFDERDLEMVETLALQTGSVIKNANLLKQERERTDALDLVQKISTQIGEVLDVNVKEKLLSILEGAMQLLDMDSGVIHLVDENRQAVVSSVEVPADFGHPVPRFSRKEGMTWTIINTGQMIAVPDIVKEPIVNPAMIVKGVKSLIDVPLVVEGKVIGVLCLNDTRKAHEFTEYDKHLLTTLAGHAAIAIRNADLLKKERARADALDLFQEISANFSAGLLDLEKILTLILEGAMQLLDMDSGVIHLVDENQQSVVHSVEVPADFLHPRPRFSGKSGMTWTIVNSGQMIAVPDITKDPIVNPAMIVKGVKSLIDVPLVMEGRVIGVLCLNDTRKAHEFTEYDKHLLTTLAGHAAIAIQNARREEQRRRAETLAVINTFGANFVHKVINLLGTLPMNFEEVEQAIEMGDERVLKAHLPLLERDVLNVKRILNAARGLKKSFGQTEKQPLQINQVIEEVIRNIHLPANIRSQTNLDPALPLIPADRTSMTNLVTDLVTNAVNAMPEGGEVRLMSTLSSDEKWIVIRVEDTGTGMKETVKSRVFEPFYTTRGDGLGLGLWLVQLAVHEMGGNIELNSEWSRGTIFTIQLPIR